MLEKAFFVFVATLLFINVVLTDILQSAEHKKHESRICHVQSKEDLPCLNKSCVYMASNILSAMDFSVDPCQDFYSYSCNGWVKANPIPDGKSTWSTFMKLQLQNQLVIKHALEQPIENFKSKAEMKAKMYYQSCLDVETVEILGAQPMIGLLRKLGGWTITDTGFNPKKWSFQNLVEVVQNKFNVGALFTYMVGVDDNNSNNKHILQIDQSGLTLPSREFYLKNKHSKVLKAYLHYMIKIGVLLGGDYNTTKEHMQAVLEFETRLANITTPNELRRDIESLYYVMTIAELGQRAKFLDWQAFFKNAMRNVNYRVTLEEKVVVYAPEYLENLSNLIQEYQSTPEGNITLNNYLVWQTVHGFTSSLSRAFRQANKELREALIGRSESVEEPRWRSCVENTNNVLEFAIGAIFIREVFHLDSKTQTEDMINNVRNAFNANLAKLEWMDEDTKRAALLKADAISNLIGYPEFIRDTKQLDEYYEQFQPRSDTYFENNIKINYYTLKKNLEKINKPVDKTTWQIATSTVNAYYTPTRNQMVFPAGILQNPFYDPSFPLSLNYGGIGVIMGYELTHAFDDQGRNFDKDGNLNHWWKNETINLFKSRTKCVVDQYNKYTIDSKNVNGDQTLRENIADNGGLKTAYHAFLSVMKDKPDPVTLPGLSLNHKQLFFVAYAQVWCSTATQEAMALQLEKDPHSPTKFRVIGALSNLEEFGEVFQCPKGSPMNPQNKCKVW